MHRIRSHEGLVHRRLILDVRPAGRQTPSPGSVGADAGGIGGGALGGRVELDINPMWPLFVTYAGGPDPASLVATKLRADMHFGADHYFAANERDFIAALSLTQDQATVLVDRVGARRSQPM